MHEDIIEPMQDAMGPSNPFQQLQNNNNNSNNNAKVVKKESPAKFENHYYA